ncbi:MAG: hypothetical protein U5J96_16270 [Ignavibacteriaceae bacterium]|nr:hypothetical protein [Ignavibacteriaceae bacterium]
MIINLLSLSLILLLVSSNSLIFAQGCCTAGSSTFGGLERGVNNYGNLNIGIGYIRNGLNSTYNGSEEIDDPLKRTASVSSFNFDLEYGLVDRVSLLISGAYVIKNRETTVRSNETNETEVISFEGQGISDIIVLGKYAIITPDIVSQMGLAIGGGVKLPVGSYTEEVNGSRLAIDLQPGTGSTDVLLWGNFFMGFLPLPFSVSANTLYRYAGSNLDGYRFGDEIIIALGGEYHFTDYLTFSLSGRARFANQDFWGGRFLPSTGGAYYDIIPSLTYTEQTYNLKVFYQAPLHRNVDGIQLTTTNLIGVELLFNFNLMEIN